MEVGGAARARGVLPGFVNSADLGGLSLSGGRTVPAGRVFRADTPPQLTEAEMDAARAVGFGLVLDLRSLDERSSCPHPLAELPAYRWLPLIDPDAEAREDFSRFRTLGDIYASSLERNAAHLAVIFSALATAAAGPVLVSCRAGRDRTGMIAALLLDLAGVDHPTIAAEHARAPGQQSADGTDATRTPDGRDIVQMLDHVRTAYGSTSGYLRRLGLDDDAVASLRRRLGP